MGKVWLILMLLVSAVAAKTLISDPKKVTRLRFYLQDVVGGDKPTLWVVAHCNLSDVLPSLFGEVMVMDNLVTSEADPNSAEVGRLQGTVGFADLTEKALVMLVNLIFTKGEYEGSTLSIIGRNPIGREVREVPIVGGTGAFRMATGYVITTTYFYDTNHVHSIYEYNAVVFRYDPAFFLSDH